MKMNLCKSTLFCFVVFSLLLAFPAFAAESTLQVKCVDSSGAAVKDVKVFIASMKSQDKTKDKKSDAEGVAEFTKLDEGAYRVFGRKEGLAPALYEFVVVQGPQQSVTLKFEAGAEKKFYFEDPAEMQKAQALLGQALEALKQNKFADAEKLFLQSLEINPSAPEALYYLAVSRIQQAKYDEAMPSLDRSAEVAAALATVPLPAGQTGANPYQQIVASVEKLKANLPAIKADDALRNKNYDQAIKEYGNAIKANPNQPELHANLAISYTNVKRFDEALAAIEKAIQLKPADAEYTKLKSTIQSRKEASILEKAQGVLDEGNKLLQGGDAAAALKKFEEARGMVPQDKQAPIWRQIGRARAKLEQPDAVEAFTKAIELAPEKDVAEYRNSLAQYYLDVKKYDAAVDVLAETKGADSAEKVLLDLAKSTGGREPKLSEAALERVIKLNPANMDAVFDLGRMYYADGKEMDKRSKELLSLYVEKGQDPAKVSEAKDLLSVISRRSK